MIKLFWVVKETVTSIKPEDYCLNKNERLAGGYGTYAAKQDAESLLRRKRGV